MLYWKYTRPEINEFNRKIAHAINDLITFDVINVLRYNKAMIKSFADIDTENIWKQHRVSSFPLEIQKIGLRKLFMLNSAVSLQDLRVPPGNRLGKLSANRRNQWSIRINDQYRICFRWIMAMLKMLRSPIIIKKKGR